MVLVASNMNDWTLHKINGNSCVVEIFIHVLLWSRCWVCCCDIFFYIVKYWDIYNYLTTANAIYYNAFNISIFFVNVNSVFMPKHPNCLSLDNKVWSYLILSYFYSETYLSVVWHITQPRVVCVVYCLYRWEQVTSCQARTINAHRSNHQGYRSPRHVRVIGWIYTCW